MTDSEQPPTVHASRVYGDEEIGRILERATELQKREPRAPATGVTLAELEEIALEAGIDPRYLRRAARELESGPSAPGLWRKLTGADVTLVRETTLQGEVDAGGFHWIVSAIQAESAEHGQPSLLGRTLTWRSESASKTRTTQVVVTSRDRRTRIRAEENLTQMASGIFGGVVVGGGVGLGVLHGMLVGLLEVASVLPVTLAPVVTVGMGYLAACGIYRAVARHRRRALDRLFDRVVNETEDAIRASGDTEEPGRLANPESAP